MQHNVRPRPALFLLEINHQGGESKSNRIETMEGAGECSRGRRLVRDADVDLVELVLHTRNRRVRRQIEHEVLVGRDDGAGPTLWQILKVGIIQIVLSSLYPCTRYSYPSASVRR